MCVAVYVASDNPLPSVESDYLHVRPISGVEEQVVTHFSKPFAHFIGASTGCACGFYYAEENDPDWEKSMDELIELLAENAVGEDLEFYVCWYGDEGKALDRRQEIGRSALKDDLSWCTFRVWTRVKAVF